VLQEQAVGAGVRVEQVVARVLAYRLAVAVVDELRAT